jgi:hypothetical protein
MNAALRIPPTTAAAQLAPAAALTARVAAEAAAANSELWGMLWELTALVYARQHEGAAPELTDLATASQSIRTLTAWIEFLRPCEGCDSHPVHWEHGGLCPRCSYEASRDEWDDREDDDRDHNSGCWSYSW